nr:sugar ABC transporter substrate-binding protein [Paludifilum halophilum]
MTLWTFVGQHAEFYQKMAKRWNQKHPNQKIELKAETYPYDNMHNKLMLSLYSKVGAPDIADIEVSRFPNYLRGKPQLVPLNDMVEPVRDRFIESRFDIYSKDGKYYGLPFHVGATVMYYNKDILDQAGDDPDQIETWDDYVRAGKKVKEKTGKPMTTVEITDVHNIWPTIIQQKSDFLDSNGRVTLDNRTNIRTLPFLRDMMDKHKIAIPAPGGSHHMEEYYGFMNQGGAASVQMPMWYMSRFTDYMPDLKGKMVIRPMPAWEKGGLRSAGMGGTGTVVTNQSEHTRLAKEFIRFSKLSKEGNIEIWKSLGFDPPRWDVWSDPELKASNEYTDYFGRGIFDQLLRLKDEIRSPHIDEPTPRLSNRVKSNVLYEALRRKNKSPEEALKDAAEEIRE